MEVQVNDSETTKNVYWHWTIKQTEGSENQACTGETRMTHVVMVRVKDISINLFILIQIQMYMEVI